MKHIWLRTCRCAKCPVPEKLRFWMSCPCPWRRKATPHSFIEILRQKGCRKVTDPNAHCDLCLEKPLSEHEARKAKMG